MKRYMTAAPAWPPERNISGLAVRAFAMLIAAVTPAAALQCPVSHAHTGRSAIKEAPARIAELSDQLDADPTGSTTTGTIFELKQRYPDASFAEIVNYMVTAYCPIVAKDNALSDEEKKDRLNRYAQQVEALAGQ